MDLWIGLSLTLVIAGFLVCGDLHNVVIVQDQRSLNNVKTGREYVTG
jgi:hypothetical protein